MNKNIKYLTCFLILSALSSTTARADFILDFEGQFFNNFLGSPPFTSTDRITGTITFDAFDNSAPQSNIQARSFSLSTTVNGNPGFTVFVADASTDSRIITNGFDFAANSLDPTGFALSVTGDFTAAFAGDEYLSITDIGDESTIDYLGPNEKIAFSFDAGTFTAIPEPTSILLVSAAFACGAGHYQIRKRRKPQV